MKELMGTQFSPVGENGTNPIQNKGEILVWEYQALGDGLKPDIVVGKTPNYGDQYLIGSEACVRALAKSFNMLDSLGFPDLRAVSVVVINRYDFDKGSYCGWDEGRSFSDELLARFGITEKLHGTRFGLPVHSLGIYTDVRYPVAMFEDVFSWLGSSDQQVAAAIYAGYLRHEFAHVEQEREDLPVNSLWAERHAMSRQAEVILGLLNSGEFKKDQQKILADYTRNLSVRIQNYRNGNGYESHLTKESLNKDGTPLKEQRLHLYDFIFGS